MPFVSVEVEGIDEVWDQVENAARTAVLRGYVNGLAAAGDVLEGAVWQRTPVDLKAAMNKAHGGKGALATKLDRVVQVDPTGRGGYVDVGFGPLGHIALWVEYGHRMVGHGKGRKVSGEVPAHPFMRPAFDSANARAIEAFVNEMRSNLMSIPGYSE